jgi:hypothetical protein
MACSPQPAAGLWFASSALTIPPDVESRLGGPLTSEEQAEIERRARAEVDHAFSGLPISVTRDPHAFWRVAVYETLSTRWNQALPRAGESMVLGVLGGSGAVGFDVVARAAVQFAAPDDARRAIIAGMGRGVGRVAVHEFTHQILPSLRHNDADADSYEYGSPDRASQYYGELHWTTAWPLLTARFAGNVKQ